MPSNLAYPPRRPLAFTSPAFVTLHAVEPSNVTLMSVGPLLHKPLEFMKPHFYFLATDFFPIRRLPVYSRPRGTASNPPRQLLSLEAVPYSEEVEFTSCWHANHSFLRCSLVFFWRLSRPCLCSRKNRFNAPSLLLLFSSTLRLAL